MKKYIVIVEATLSKQGTQSNEFKEYSEKATINNTKYGAIVKEKYIISENIAQGLTSSLVIVLEFPSKENAQKAFSNEEYLSLIPLRELAFKELKILMTSE